MRITKSVVLVGCALLMLAASPALAQEPPTPPAPEQAPPPANEPAMIEGELARVDGDKKLVVVKTADGTEVEVAYNEQTEISGAISDAAGLATAREALVTVHFTEDAETKAKTATRIIVQPKQ